MPRESSAEIEGRNHPRRYVRLDELGRPYPAPELVDCVGELPAPFSWADSFARPLYRSAVRQLFDAALRRAEARRHRVTGLRFYDSPPTKVAHSLYCPPTKVVLQIENWMLRWEYYLKKEAEQYDNDSNASDHQHGG
jgi:hypothetical protein